jgi:hypothetical protein
MEKYLVVCRRCPRTTLLRQRLVSWVSIRSPRQQVSKGGSVKEYVNYVSMPEYGLDCQSRCSKSCVVNDGSLSTGTLRVAIGYRGTRSQLFRLGFSNKKRRKWVENRTERRGKRSEQHCTLLKDFPVARSHPRGAMLQDLHLKMCFCSMA